MQTAAETTEENQTHLNRLLQATYNPIDNIFRFSEVNRETFRNYPTREPISLLSSVWYAGSTPKRPTQPGSVAFHFLTHPLTTYQLIGS